MSKFAEDHQPLVVSVVTLLIVSFVSLLGA